MVAAAVAEAAVVVAIGAAAAVGYHACLLRGTKWHSGGFLWVRYGKGGEQSVPGFGVGLVGRGFAQENEAAETEAACGECVAWEPGRGAQEEWVGFR